MTQLMSAIIISLLAVGIGIGVAIWLTRDSVMIQENELPPPVEGAEKLEVSFSPKLFNQWQVVGNLEVLIRGQDPMGTIWVREHKGES